MKTVMRLRLSLPLAGTKNAVFYSMLMLYLVTPGAIAESLGWYDQPYPYLVVNQEVRDVIEAFGTNLGLRVVVAEDVRGTVEKKVFENTAGNFLLAISETADLAWYVGESGVYFDSNDNVLREHISTSGYAETDIRKTIGALQKPGRGTSLLYDGASQQVIAMGPLSYLVMVRQAIGRLPVQTAKKESTTTKIFRGTEVQVQSY